MTQPDFTVYDHLAELRRRLLIVIIAMLSASVFCYFYVPAIVKTLQQPLAGFKLDLVYFTVTEGFTTRLKLAVFVAAVLLSPLIFYQAAAFINPGLTSREKKVVYRGLALISALFILGAVGGYIWVMPVLLKWFIRFGLHYMKPVFSGNAYFSFIVMLCLVTGVTFTIPGILRLGSKLGLIDARLLLEFRKYVILGMIGLGTMIAPMADLLTFILLAVPVILLYEISIWIVYWSEKRQAKKRVQA